MIPATEGIVRFSENTPGPTDTTAAAPVATAAVMAACTVNLGANTEPAFASLPCLLT